MPFTLPKMSYLMGILREGRVLFPNAFVSLIHVYKTNSEITKDAKGEIVIQVYYSITRSRRLSVCNMIFKNLPQICYV